MSSSLLVIMRKRKVNVNSVALILTVLLLILNIQDSLADGGAYHWAYSGVDDAAHWYNHYTMCSGSKQSPIDIDPASAVPQNFLPIFLSNYDTTDKPLTLTNNGHTVLLNLPRNYPEYRVPYVKDGGLTNTFIFSQVHIHWGSEGVRGSEHTIKNKHYDAELHFVHYNKKYGSMGNATSHPDGLAVLGVFVASSGVDNPAFDPITNNLDKVLHEGNEWQLNTTLSLRDLIPASTSKFYRYQGSLTTPGCNEIVVWTVFDSPITISDKQIEKFRELIGEDGDVLVNNYRPAMPLMGRTVHVRSTGSYPYSSSLLLILCLFLIL